MQYELDSDFDEKQNFSQSRDMGSAHTFIRSSQPDQVSREQFRHEMHSNCKIIHIVHILYFHRTLEATIFIPHRIVSRNNRTRLRETGKQRQDPRTPDTHHYPGHFSTNHLVQEIQNQKIDTASSLRPYHHLGSSSAPSLSPQ